MHRVGKKRQRETQRERAKQRAEYLPYSGPPLERKCCKLFLEEKRYV